MTHRRVVVSGLGVVSPLGCTVDGFWESLQAGRSGIRTVEQFDASGNSSKIGGEVVDLNIDDFVPKKEQRKQDPFCHFALAASRLALADSGLDVDSEDPSRIGVIVGSGVGGLQTIQIQHMAIKEKGPDRCSPFTIPGIIANMGAGLIAIDCGVTGPNYAVVSACATGAHCIGDAIRLIQRGDIDAAIAGGAEAAICELAYGAFCAMKALSSKRNDDPTAASRPFDADRDGFVMGEGAGILIVEELEHAKKRGAQIYCELPGFGLSCDAHHMTAPPEGGEGAAQAMTMALADANIPADQVSYINAHGTSTPLGDRGETRAIKSVLGDHAGKVMVSSTKSMMGHLLGAAGGVEAAVCALALKHGVVPPTINYETPDPDCDLDYVPNTAREADVQVCLNNSFGFGGHNASLVLSKFS